MNARLSLVLIYTEGVRGIAFEKSRTVPQMWRSLASF